MTWYKGPQARQMASPHRDWPFVSNLSSMSSEVARWFVHLLRITKKCEVSSSDHFNFFRRKTARPKPIVRMIGAHCRAQIVMILTTAGQPQFWRCISVLLLFKWSEYSSLYVLHAGPVTMFEYLGLSAGERDASHSYNVHQHSVKTCII